MSAAEPAPPTLATLMDWLEGRLGDEAAAQVAARVAEAEAADERDGDTRLTADLCWLRGFREVAAQVPLHPPPPLVRQSLARHFDAWQQARTLTRRRRRLVTTHLLFDSRSDRPLALVRSAAEPREAVQLGFTSAAADLVVDVTPAAEGRVRLDGQVLALDPSAPSAYEVVAEGPGFRLRSVDGDEEGRFVLADVPIGVRSLTVANADLELRAELRLDPDPEVDPGADGP